MDSENLLLAFGLTLVAGLSTGFGGLIALFWKATNSKFLSIMLGLSAGVMIFVSFVDIYPKASTILAETLGDQKQGSWVTAIAFFAGIMLIAIIDKLVPEAQNPHETKNAKSMGYCGFNGSSKLLRTGLFTAGVIAIHNFPEGIATFTSAMRDPSIGIPIAFAIAIHNIPEGMSVAIPVYCATGNRKRAFKYSLLSGLAEPLGAIIGYLVLMPFMNDLVFGILFAAIAGIMVYISLDELLPSAREYGEHHLSIAGLIAGMAIMSISLLVLS